MCLVPFTSIDIAFRSERSSSSSIRNLQNLCIGVSVLFSTESGNENSVRVENILPEIIRTGGIDY